MVYEVTFAVEVDGEDPTDACQRVIELFQGPAENRVALHFTVRDEDGADYGVWIGEDDYDPEEDGEDPHSNPRG